MNSNIIYLALLFLTSLPNLSAQAPSEEHKVRFRTIGWMVSTEDLYYECKHKDAKISVIDAARSLFYDAPAEKQFTFYRLITGPDDKKVRQVVATVDITEAGKWPLLLFVTDPSAPDRYRVTAIADDTKTFPFPSARFINLTNVELNIAYGKQKFKLPAKEIRLIDPELKAESDTRFAIVSADTADGPALLYSNNWVVRRNYRTLVFIFPSDDKMRVMRIQDDSDFYYTPQPRNNPE